MRPEKMPQTNAGVSFVIRNLIAGRLHCLSQEINDRLITLHLPPEVNQLLLSKLLGYGIIAGSMFVKVPQLLKIIFEKSARGLSVSAVLLELLCCTATSAYSFYLKFPFSSYGDAVFLVLQNTAIAFLILSWEQSYFVGTFFLGTYVAFAAYCFSPLVPLKTLSTMQAGNTPVVLFSRGLQIWANFRNGSTGQLSVITVGLMTAGSLARIFTSIQETNDFLIVVNYVASSTANLILLAQIAYYWRSELPPVEERKKKE
ncbi:Mannose-P-dolichol utilization defect 1 protein [Sparganum proliferum]